MNLKFLGGARTVTGSWFLLNAIILKFLNLKILGECGLYQGENAEEINRAPFDFNPEEIDYVFITPAYLDHAGMPDL